MAPHQGVLSSGCPFTRVSSHQGVLSSGCPLIRVSSHQGVLSSGCPLIRVSSHQSVRSSGCPLIRVSSHQGVLSLGCPFIIRVSIVQTWGTCSRVMIQTSVSHQRPDGHSWGRCRVPRSRCSLTGRFCTEGNLCLPQTPPPMWPLSPCCSLLSGPK